MTGKEIKQSVEIKAPAQAVYDALMNSKQHAEFTRAAANIDNKVEGEFSVWDGYATGKNIELEPAHKIVQTWHASDWPDGVESKLTIVLTEKDGVTTIDLHQTGVPEEFVDDVATGWQDYYWEPLKDYLEKS
jgi:activator of HSP90 ATPase